MGKTRLAVVRRDHTPAAMLILNPVIFVILALAFCGIFMIAQGFSPIAVYAKMFKTAFGSAKGWSKSILTGVPLMLCGLGVSVAFKMNLNNIGAEGQYAMGALTSTGFILFGPKIPVGLQIPVMFLIALVTGAIWALLAAIPKAFWGVNETIVTLMLNYIALLALDYVCFGPWKDSSGLNLPYSETIPETAKLPMMFGGKLSTGFVIAVIVAIIMYLFFRYTTTGYQINVVKNSLTAARYAGINVKKNILIVLAISGALAGLTGAVKITETMFRLQPELPAGAGFTAIVIAYMSKFNPLIVILVGIFFGGLEKGSYAVQTEGLPVQLSTMIQGAILVFVLAGEFFNYYKIKRVGKIDAEKEA